VITLRRAFMMSMIPSANWLQWLPTKMTGPSSGIFFTPMTSTELKKTVWIACRKARVA